MCSKIFLYYYSIFDNYDYTVIHISSLLKYSSLSLSLARLLVLYISIYLC